MNILSALNKLSRGLFILSLLISFSIPSVARPLTSAQLQKNNDLNKRKGGLSKTKATSLYRAMYAKYSSHLKMNLKELKAELSDQSWERRNLILDKVPDSENREKALIELDRFQEFVESAQTAKDITDKEAQFLNSFYATHGLADTDVKSIRGDELPPETLSVGDAVDMFSFFGAALVLGTIDIILYILTLGHAESLFMYVTI